jgi:hypothetical protein
VKWISVKDEEPDDGADCLIAVPLYDSKTLTFKRYEICHATYWPQEKRSYFTTCEGEEFDSGDEVPYWMPLPDPPTE